MHRCCLVLALALTCRTAITNEPEGARGAAFEFAKKLVTPTLKNPASAEFDWESVQYERTIRLPSPSGDEKMEVVMIRGVVRATNSFNAVVPSEWRVLMQHADGIYTPIGASLNGEDVLQTELSGHVLATIDRARAKKDEEPRAKAAEKAKADAAERERQAVLTKAFDQGKKTGKETAERMKWNKVRVPDENITRAMQKALEGQSYSPAEVGEFSRGFMESADAIRRK